MATPMRVLILEDVPVDAELMVHELRRAGFDPDWQRVETESDYLAHLDPALDLILADYNMPSFSALQALRHLQERGLDIPLIVITGTLGDEAAAECIKRGATDYLLKDRLARLGPAVTQALEQARLRDKRRRVEERLRLQELALESAANAIVIADREGRITWVNPAFTRLTGYTAQEAAGENPRFLRSGKHDEAFYRNLWETILSGQAWYGEVINRRKDGSLYTEEQMITPVHDERGAISHFIAIKQDITERKRAEETLQALHRASLHIQEPLGLRERLDRLLQTARDVLHLDRLVVLLSDPEGRWLKAVASLGTEEPLESIRVPIGPEGGGLAKAYLTKGAIFWDGSGPVPEDLRLRPPYDEIASLRSKAFANVPLVVQGRAIGVLGVDSKRSRRPLHPEMHHLLQLFAGQAALAIEHGRLYEAQRMAAIQLEATVEDRTLELRAANAQLQEAMRQAQSASRHKSAFLANMSHELRTPLNSILGFSELLAQKGYGPLTGKQARYVDNIHTSGEHLLALINDLLDLSKIEAGKLELRAQAFDLREVLEAALHTIRLHAEAKQQLLHHHVADDVSNIVADQVRIKQILYNLLSNAVKFTPAGGSITVTARQVHSSQLTVDRPRTSDRELSTVDRKPSGEFLEIAVTDTGIGINPEDLPKLFQPFTQLEQTLTRQTQGTGLGLALTRHLVELHGGTIWADSAGEGRGSTFTIWLPPDVARLLKR